MYYQGMLITNKTLSIVKPIEKAGKELYQVSVFVDCKLVFEKAYKTFLAANQVNTKMINKFHGIK